LYAKWGKDGSARLNQIAKAGAIEIANSPECGEFTVLESGNADTAATVEEVKFWADCDKPIKRFYYSAADMGTPVHSEFEKAKRLDEAMLFRTCLDKIQGEGKVSAGEAPNGNDTNIYLAPTTGRTVVTLHFGGGDKPVVGEECYFDPNGSLVSVDDLQP
jgi:hypothetical protein